MPTKFFQHLGTTNDTNGNPRRVYVVYDADGFVCAVYNEGYRGIPKEIKGLTQLPGFNITPGDYRECVRLAKSNGHYFEA